MILHKSEPTRGQLIADLARPWRTAELVVIASVIYRGDSADEYVEHLRAGHFTHKMTKAVARVVVQVYRTYGVADIETIRSIVVVHQFPPTAISVMLDAVEKIGQLLTDETIGAAFHGLARREVA